MSVRHKYFDAGWLAGVVDGLRLTAETTDADFAHIETSLRDLLKELGVPMKAAGLPPFSDLPVQIRDLFGDDYSTCFVVGWDFSMLTQALLFHTVKTSADAVSNKSVASLRALVSKLRLSFAEINAPEESVRFLTRVLESLNDAHTLFSASAQLLADSQVERVRVRSSVKPPASSEARVLHLKPSIYGIGVDLEALWKRARRLWNR